MTFNSHVAQFEVKLVAETVCIIEYIIIYIFLLAACFAIWFIPLKGAVTTFFSALFNGSLVIREYYMKNILSLLAFRFLAFLILTFLNYSNPPQRIGSSAQEEVETFACDAAAGKSYSISACFLL